MRYSDKAIKLKVRMQMSRDNNRQWHLRIGDEASGLAILEVEFGHEDISDLMTTMTTQACVSDYFPDKSIGKNLEVKTVMVYLTKLPGALDSDDEKDRKRDLNLIYALAEQENPGWTADRNAFSSNKVNYHFKNYSVTMRRYLDSQE